jgi:hypothetical protein
MLLQNTNRPAKSTSPCWRLLAIGLDSDKTAPELYAAIHEGEVDVPLMVDERIVFFADPKRASKLIQKYGGPWIHDAVDVAHPTLWCDVAASGAKMIDSRRRALHAIADYCTTSKDLTKYLEEVGDRSSRELVDAVLWCMSAVVMKARIL